MATNEFVTTPVASYLWAENPPARNHHAMPECSNYQSSRLGLKPWQWRASVRVLNPAKAEEQNTYIVSVCLSVSILSAANCGQVGH